MSITSFRARAAATSALVGMLSACAAAPAEAPPRDARYSLTEGQQVALGPDVALLYDGFTDSRCPKNVVCIWAGRISYRFTLATRAGKEAFELTPGGPAFVPAPPTKLTIALADADAAAASATVKIDVSTR